MRTNSADFLQRLSVKDAQKLLEQTRVEKHSKEKEMQQMMGSDYRELIESADKIMQMYDASTQLLLILKNLPAIYTKLFHHVSKTEKSPEVEEATAVSDQSDLDLLPGRVKEIVDLPEKIWSALDKALVFDALVLYKKMEMLSMHPSIQQFGIDYFPFLKDSQAYSEDFPQRILYSANNCLLIRGQPSKFYGDALCVFSLLDPANINICDLVDLFLTSRSKWISEAIDALRLKSSHSSYFDIRLAFTVVLRTIQDTLLHYSELFTIDCASSIPAFSQSVVEHTDVFVNQEMIVSQTLLLEGKYCSKSILRRDIMEKWVHDEIDKFHREGSELLGKISSIEELAKLQQSLMRYLPADFYLGQWNSLFSSEGPFHDFSLPHIHNDNAFDLWLVLFDDIFVYHTGILLQRSYQSALQNFESNFMNYFDVFSNNNNGCNDSKLTSASDFNKGDVSIDSLNLNQQRPRFEGILNGLNKNLENIQSNAVVLKQDNNSSIQKALLEQCVVMLIALVCFLQKQHTRYKNMPDNQAELTVAGKSVSENERNIWLEIAHINIALAKCYLLPSLKSLLTLVGGGSRHKESKSTVDDIQRVFGIYASSNSQTLSGEGLVKAVKDLGPDCSCMWQSNDSISLDLDCFRLFILMKNGSRNLEEVVETKFLQLAAEYASFWAQSVISQLSQPLFETVAQWEAYQFTNQEWRNCHGRWHECAIEEEESESGNLLEERFLLPYAETPTVGHLLFTVNCVYLQATTASSSVLHMNDVLRLALKDSVISEITKIYSRFLRTWKGWNTHHSTEENSDDEESCILQLLFDIFFVLHSLGLYNSFTNKKKIDSCALRDLIVELQELIDPINWQLYGPSLVDNVATHYNRSKLLYSSLQPVPSKIDAKTSSGSMTAELKPFLKLTENNCSRFSLLPVPKRNKKPLRRSSSSSATSKIDPEVNQEQSSTNSVTAQVGVRSGLFGSKGVSIQSINSMISDSRSTFLSSASAYKSASSFLSSATSYLPTNPSSN